MIIIIRDAHNINSKGSWCPLNQLVTGTANCIIGVVAFVGRGGMSASGGMFYLYDNIELIKIGTERFQRLNLVDTSNVNKEKIAAGFSLTCFARGGHAKDCLPEPSIGDILLMRDAKVSGALFIQRSICLIKS
jgi:hypothetical protein